MPRRIQRRRTKGWKMPAGAIYVGRPTKWGNPYSYPRDPDPIRSFRRFLHSRSDLIEDARRELRGKDLACWCPEGAPCHADILLVVANQ